MFRDRSAAIASPFRALALGFSLALTGATMAAAQQAPAQPQQDQATPPELAVKPKWHRLCGQEQGGVEVCTTTSMALAPNNQVFAEVQLFEVKGGPSPSQNLRVTIQPGALISPGIVLIVDDQDATEQQITARYQVCFPNSCIADTPISADVINRMKRGSTMLVNVAVMGPEGKPQWMPGQLSLAGFTAAFDGQPTDPQEYEAWMKSFQESQNTASREIEEYLLRRGSNQREQLQGGQQPAPAN